MSYIIFLLSLAGNDSLPELIKCQLHKNIIIHSTSILEAIILWKLLNLIETHKITIEQIQPEQKEYAFIQIKSILTTEGKEVVACFKEVKPLKLENDTQFLAVNKAALRCGLFTRELFNEAERLRKLRNKIHLTALEAVDDQYTQSEVEAVFQGVNKITKRVEDYEC